LRSGLGVFIPVTTLGGIIRSREQKNSTPWKGWPTREERR